MDELNTFVYTPMVQEQLLQQQLSPQTPPQQQPSPPLSQPQPPQSQPMKRKKKKDKPVSQACIICSHDHASCDDARPCKRCVAKGFPHLCKNPVKSKPAKKGRPARALNKYTSIVEEAQNDYNNIVYANNNGNNGYGIMDITNVENTLFIGNNTQPVVYAIESDTTLIYNTSYNSQQQQQQQANNQQQQQQQQQQQLNSFSTMPTYVQQPGVFSLPSPQASLQAMNDFFSTNDVFSFSAPSLPVTVEEKVTAGSKEADKQLTTTTKQSDAPSSELCYDECDFCITHESGVQRLFSHLAIKTEGQSSNSPDLAMLTSKVKLLRSSVMKNLTVLEDSFQARFMSLQSHCLQITLPVILCCGLFIITVNAAACELFRMKKGELLSRKFIFNLFSKDSCMPFMKKWAESVVDCVDLDRMKVKVEGLGGAVHDCILSATVHRELNSGCPLMEMYILVRVDDM